MKNAVFTFLFLVLTTSIFANSPEIIQLKRPNLRRGLPLMETLSKRESLREFRTDTLTLTDLSDLLWAAVGVNRSDGKRTSPTAMNQQEISVYAFLPQGVYLYNAQRNQLKLIQQGDHRKLLNGKQDFADKGALGLLYVANTLKFSNLTPDALTSLVAMDAGIVCQNVNLFCAAVGLANVPRVSMDNDAISRLLRLPSSSRPMMNNIIGYKK